MVTLGLVSLAAVFWDASRSASFVMIFCFLENQAQTRARAFVCVQNYLLKHLTRAYMASTKTLHFSL